MLNVFEKWYRRYLFEEESILLLVLLALAVVLLVTIGDMMAPVLASIVLAFLMQGMAVQLQRHGLPQWAGVTIAFLVFVGTFFITILGVLPLVWKQMTSLVSELPRMLEHGRDLLITLPEQLSGYVTTEQLNEVLVQVQREMGSVGQTLVTKTLSSIPGLFTVMLYMILIPILVFFFLKDRELILDWLAGFLPEERPLLSKIWVEMNTQFANYARGKVVEVIIVGIVAYVAFAALGLNYAALLGLGVGLSVIIPYIGAVIITIPVVLVALFQWGIGPEFYWVLGVYLVIQALDGNVLVPWLFSEAVNLHPVAIILAVLFFGGIWGMWGVFFAIPLATLIKAVINAWPEPQNQLEDPDPETNT